MLRDVLTDILLAAAILLASGCSPVQPPFATTQPTSLILSQSLAGAATAWRADADRRFGPGTFIFVCHGTSDPITHRWVGTPDHGPWLDMETVARVLSEEHRVSLLITCNEGHKLHDPKRNVFYADRSVWDRPHLWFPGNGVDRIENFHN